MLELLRSVWIWLKKCLRLTPLWHSENRVPDIWERLADGDGAAISLLIEEIKERKALMKTLFDGTQRMKTVITRDLNLAKLELEICQKKMMSVEGKVANFFKALEQTENADKLITTNFLKKIQTERLDGGRRRGGSCI